MTDFVNTAISAAKTPLFTIGLPLVVGTVIVALVTAFMSKRK